MGRGRQKAKQTKVARELKYSIYEPNYRALEQELGQRHPGEDGSYDSWSEPESEDDSDEDDSDEDDDTDELTR